MRASAKVKSEAPQSSAKIRPNRRAIYSALQR